MVPEETMANPIRRIKSFYQAVVSELGKCTWPTWEELYESTVVVIVSALMVSVFVFVVDIMVRTVVRWVT